MRLLSIALCWLVTAAHLGFLVLEMFFWNHPVGRKIFAMSPEFSASSAVLAMNQGLYNGFIAAGLVWGIVAKRTDIKVFFLACAIVAGVFGAITAKPTILFIQALPAALALVAVLLSNKKSSGASYV
jgi:putative membrane protein